MAKAYGRTVSGVWWLFGFACAFLFRISGTYAQAQAEYGARLRVDPCAKRAPAPLAPMPPGWRPVNPNDRADAERLLSRLSEPVKAVEPTAKERDDAKDFCSKLLKSAGESETHAKAGRTEEAQKSNRERLDAFQNLVKLGPSALEYLRGQKTESEKDGKATGFARSQIPLAIRRIEADARAGLQDKIGRLGQGALDALGPREQKAADDVREARDRVGSLERELASADGAEKERLQRELTGTKETLEDAQALRDTLRSVRAKAAAEVAKNPPPPVYRPPAWDRPQPAYGVFQARYMARGPR